MSTTLLYGLILAAAGAAFNLLAFFLGFQTDKMAQATWFNWLALIPPIIVIWLGIKATREEAADKSLSFGKGVITGLLISIYNGLVSAAYNYVHFKFINPDFYDYQLDLVRTKWAEAGLSEAQMEQAESITRKFMGAGVTAAMTPVMCVAIGLVVALIVSAFLKRPAPIPPPPGLS